MATGRGRRLEALCALLVLVTACAPAGDPGPEADELDDGKADVGTATDRDPRSKYPYRPFSPAGEPFLKGSRDRVAIDPSDVWQDGITDCWLMSTMAAVARANPWAIERLIKPRADGRYDVTLYVGPTRVDRDGSISRDPRVFVVAATFPTKSDGTLAYAKPQDVGPDGPELWPLLLEKAYAQYLGRYEGDIPLVGRNLEYDATPAFRQLLPRGDQDTYDPAKQDVARALDVLGRAFDEHRPATALVTSHGPLESVLAARYGITTWHHYAIASIDRAAQTIDLQDPRADEHHPTGVPIDAFLTVFSWYTVGPTAD